MRGGYNFRSSHDDPGGATNLGVTLATLTAWRKRPTSIDDLKHLSKDEAKQIGRTQYWAFVRGDDLPKGLDYSVFDFAYNSGPVTAIKKLQTMIGASPDGHIRT
jgi:lysozyme family protein